MPSVGRPPTPIIERILSRTTQPSEGCWLYSGATNGRGYGIIGQSDPDRRMVYVHRVMYVLAHGPIPEGCEVAHTCDVRNCVRPSHLVAMTHAGNVADANGKGRNNSYGWQGRAKVTEDDVRQIRWLVEHDNVRRAAVAEEYGISVGMVDKIVTRKSWKQVH